MVAAVPSWQAVACTVDNITVVPCHSIHALLSSLDQLAQEATVEVRPPWLRGVCRCCPVCSGNSCSLQRDQSLQAVMHACMHACMPAHQGVHSADSRVWACGPCLQAPDKWPKLAVVDSISALLSPVIGASQHNQGENADDLDDRTRPGGVAHRASGLLLAGVECVTQPAGFQSRATCVALTLRPTE